MNLRNPQPSRIADSSSTECLRNASKESVSHTSCNVSCFFACFFRPVDIPFGVLGSERAVDHSAGAIPYPLDACYLCFYKCTWSELGPTVDTVPPDLASGAPDRPAGPALGTGVPAVRLALERHWVLECRPSAGTGWNVALECRPKALQMTLFCSRVTSKTP